MNILSRILNWYFSRTALPYWCILLIDYTIVIFSGILAYYFLRGGDALIHNFWNVFRELCILLIPYTISFRIFHTYSGIFRYSSFVDLARLLAAIVVGSILGYVGSLFIPDDIEIHFLKYPNLLLVSLLIASLFMCALRVLVKTLYDLFRVDKLNKRIFIYGVQDGGISLAKSIRNEIPNRYIIKGFATSDTQMKGKWLMGLPVWTDGDDLVSVMQRQDATILMVSPLQTAHFREQDKLINDLINANIKIMMMPFSEEEWDGKSELRYSQLHEVDIEDLLPRDKIEVDMMAIGRQLNANRILITGAAGSIGSEMVHQIARFEPRKMILIDQAETPMHDVRRMMASKYPNIPCHTIVASITNKTYMEEIFRRFHPDYVFHAAAYKHVPMMEDNPAMAIQNNVYGTRVIADLAVKYGTKKFVMISTDKAVNPTNVMGCSKRICEIYCQALNKAIEEMKTQQDVEKIKESNPIYSSLLQANGTLPCTQFVTTRFGNVLGSNGSVIPYFRKQIAAGGPLTVTHPEIIRYFMTIPEACCLVMEASTLGAGGEIFVFDMGKPVKILDLARNMIRLAGYTPEKDIPIVFTGLRPGEKLYEELLNQKETTMPTTNEKIMVARVREFDFDQISGKVDKLISTSRLGKPFTTVKMMKQLVPEYISNNSIYEQLDPQ